MLTELVENAHVFLLIFVRVFALLQVAPLLSSGSIPGVARAGLAFFAAFAVFPWVNEAGYPIPDTGLMYAMLVVGEALIGIVIGFFLSLVYTAFQVAGQFFSLQMGFGASQVFDPLAQIEVPLLGQFLNVVAMFVFVSIQGFQRVFIIGVQNSFQAMRAVDLAVYRDDFYQLLLDAFLGLFQQALIISFPILGTLFLVSLTTGLLAKAAPQMNLLMLGFPISIGTAFIVMFLAMPFIMNSFDAIITMSFDNLLQVMRAVGGGGQ